MQCPRPAGRSDSQSAGSAAQDRVTVGVVASGNGRLISPNCIISVQSSTRCARRCKQCPKAASDVGGFSSAPMALAGMELRNTYMYGLDIIFHTQLLQVNMY